MNYSKAAKAAVAKYGEDVCIRAYSLHRAGEGANTVAHYCGIKDVRGNYSTQGADAAINAGREYFTGSIPL